MAKYNSLESLVQSRTSSRLGASPSLESLASLGSQASKWDLHVQTTLRRNERIRMQNEASKLRVAFVNSDKQLSGYVPVYMLKHCLRAGDVILPEEERKGLEQKWAKAGHFY